MPSDTTIICYLPIENNQKESQQSVIAGFYHAYLAFNYK